MCPNLTNVESHFDTNTKVNLLLNTKEKNQRLSLKKQLKTQILGFMKSVEHHKDIVKNTCSF